jgi:hypothetical protein
MTNRELWVHATGVSLGCLLCGCTQIIDSGNASYAPDKMADASTVAPNVKEANGRDSLSLEAGSPNVGDRFGGVLLLTDDELIVAAPGAALSHVHSTADASCGANVDVETAGAVFALDWNGKSWHENVHEIRRARADDSDGDIEPQTFIESKQIALARAGDLLAVGLPGMNYGACVTGNPEAPFLADAGGVYLYRRDDHGDWHEVAFVTSAVPITKGWFGAAVALRGDDLFVGAPGENSSMPEDGSEPTNGGAVYVFHRHGDTWSDPERLHAANDQNTARFGFAIAVDGDTLAVGAFFDSHGERGINPEPVADMVDYSGAAYVFREVATGKWNQEAYIKADNAEGSDLFGIAVGLESDTLVVGAPIERASMPMPNATSDWLRQSTDNTKQGAGAVYVYRRTGTDWKLHAYLKAPKPQSGASFGASLALHDGRLLVGALTEGVRNVGSPPADDSGAAYLYEDLEPGTVPRAFRHPFGGKEPNFGFAVAFDSHWAAIAAPKFEDDTGVVQMFDLTKK